MRTMKVEVLNVEKLLPFGVYANLINPRAEKIGSAPIEFFRDMLQQNLGGHACPSYSVCRVEKRDLIIDVTEYHTATEEGILPLDQDVLIHVGPATPDAKPPLDKLRVFRVPAGTLVVLRPGVWHHAPFAADGRPAHVLIILPERTYANDCIVVKISEPERIAIAR